MAEPTPTTSDRDSRSPGNEDRAKEGYQPGGSATTIPLNPSGAIEGVENLPPEPEPRIKDPASTISVNTATSFGGTTPLPIGAGRTMKQVIDLARERGDVQKLKKQEIFINLSTPLNIKTKHGEVQAGPGDIVMRVGGHHAVFSQDAFEELEGFDFSTGNWDNLLRETLKRGVIARRLDDGNRLPMTPEQEAEADENIEREVANAREARDTERARKQKLVDAFSMQGKEGEGGATVAQVWKPVDSGEGPPTATPSETATLVPQSIPIEVIDAGGEAPPPEQGDATGATAGSPGSFTPSGATPAADLAGLSACTASPTTPWTEGQHVVLGDNSHAYWDGTTWQTGDAPPPIVRGGGSVPQSPNVPQARR